MIGNKVRGTLAIQILFNQCATHCSPFTIHHSLLTTMMILSELFTTLPQARTRGKTYIEIELIVSDSRQVQPGDLFVAYSGVNADGRRFIGEAIERGAVAAVIEDQGAERELGKAGDVSLFPIVFPYFPRDFPVAFVADGRAALAQLSAAWHGYPARQLRMIGVTGTDGKTTTATLIRSILQTAGHETGLISTVAAYIGARKLDTGFHTTTPIAPDLQNYLAEMVMAGARYAVLEATSEGLAQQRLAGCDFDVAVLTNITHEHLNAHHDSFDEYRAAKRMLFEQAAYSDRKPDTPKVSVLNADDAAYAEFAATPMDVRISYGVTQPADVRAERITHSAQGLSFVATFPSPHTQRETALVMSSPLLGRYNVSNILAAISVGLSQQLPLDALHEGVRGMRGVTGRMELLNYGQPFTIIVDFAHTPNALAQALSTARELTAGKVSIVFGCAGLKDTQKRPLMGEIAGRLADNIIITAEDPRTESLDDIMQQIAEGCERAGRRRDDDYHLIGDRREAIAFALKNARRGDLVIITGKGHERSMCFGATEYPWSDHEAVKAILVTD